MTTKQTLAPAELLALVNETQQPAPVCHRLTLAEATERAQLLALFDRSDARGQALLLQIAGIHAARYPKDKA